MAKPSVCIPKTLTPAQSEAAIRRSIEINPANAFESRMVERTPPGRRGGPRRLALLVGNRWPASGMQFTVQFLDNASESLRKRILEHMNAWNQTANVRFVETHQTGMVRIARLDQPEEMAGYWSYEGTEILGIEADQPTMNLEGFTMQTSEAEFRRVVRHETGHTLGFTHEHLRSDLIAKINRSKAIAYFDRECGWSKEDTILQVLTPLSTTSIMGTTESDPLSIMCYEVPGEITKDGKPIVGGTDINSNDFRFAGKIYPKPTAQADTPMVMATPTSQEPFVEPQDDEAFHIVVMDAFDPTGRAAKGNLGGKQATSPKYAQVFASYAGARVTSAMRLRSDDNEPPTLYGKIIGTHEKIKRYTNLQKGTLPTDKQLMNFGIYLFDTLFQGDVRRLYDEARARQRSGKLDIIFTSMIPWIAEKPWEFAYDAVRQCFLATEEIHFVRNVLTAIPANLVPAHSGPLRMLVAAAQPLRAGHLSVEQEVAVIRRGFQPLMDAGLMNIDVLARTTPSRLHERLSTQEFSIVHFIGHGTFNDKTQEGALLFEDDHGGQIALGERSIREVFCQRGISLVFLNSCQSGSGGKSDFNKGIAQSLVSHGMPALVANQYSVLDSSATSFAKHFYWSLAHGMSVSQAACEARIAVNYTMQGELIDWAVPVVYARDPNMTLSVKPDKVVESKSTTIRGASRSDIESRSTQVAVWDIDDQFPALERTLERMNGVQSAFGFELANLSTPIDAWDYETPAQDGTPYLWAEKLVHRLQHSVVELRVNILACITRHWLRDDEWLNLYGWWPENKTPPVLIFSTAGFDLAPESLETDRALANVTVSGLAGFFGEMETHLQGAKDCPLAFDQQRNPAVLTGRQVFDQACRKKLEQRIPAMLPALNALLKTFH